MRHSVKVVVLSLLVVAACFLAACAGPNKSLTSLDAYPASDMSSYDCARDYTATYQFVDMTVADIIAEMDAGSTFIVYAGYNHCPWCNSILNHLNDLAIDRDFKIGYLNTRAKAEWQSNLDITDYDVFAQRFASVLPDDDEGRKHLYVPHIFFIQKGQVVADHPGTVPSQEDSNTPLTEAQVEEFRATISGYVDRIAS